MLPSENFIPPVIPEYERGYFARVVEPDSDLGLMGRFYECPFKPVNNHPGEIKARGNGFNKSHSRVIAVCALKLLEKLPLQSGRQAFPHFVGEPVREAFKGTCLPPCH